MLWCCCEQQAVQTIEIDHNGIGIELPWEWWNTTNGELDPVIGRFAGTPFFAHSSTFRRCDSMLVARPAAFGGIPVRTYTSIVLKIMGEAVDAMLQPSATDYPAVYHIYCWRNGKQFGDFGSRFVSGIARSELEGPIVWDATGENWIGQAFRFTPNLASIINPVINAPGWLNTSMIHLVWDMVGAQQPQPLNPPGRDLLAVAGNTFTLSW